MKIIEKKIWVADFAATLEECIFFAVEITEGSYLSNAAYNALLFNKLVRMIDESRDADLIEDIELYFPSLIGLSEKLSNEDLVLMIVESEENYFGFPAVEENYVKCIRLDELAKNGIDELDKDEFTDYFEENYNFKGFMNIVTDLHDRFLAANSNHIEDTKIWPS